MWEIVTCMYFFLSIVAVIRIALTMLSVWLVLKCFAYLRYEVKLNKLERDYWRLRGRW